MVATRALFEGDHELSPMLCLGFGRNLPKSELVVLPLSLSSLTRLGHGLVDPLVPSQLFRPGFTDKMCGSLIVPVGLWPSGAGPPYGTVTVAGLRQLERDGSSLNRWGVPKIRFVLIQHAGCKGGQHGWDDPIRTTFVSGW
jgi:hypothetical protein